MNLKKHIGVLNNTGSRVVVVFRKVPDDENHCLLVETDRLPDMYHDNMMEILNSREAQETNDFYDVLNRRTFTDGLNALQALHHKGFLRKIPVELVTLLPMPGQKLPLELANAQADGSLEEYIEKTEKEKSKAVEVNKDILSDPNSPTAIAKGLLLEAELLESEASKKRTEAYAMDPSLKKTKTSTKKVSSKPAESGEPRKRGRPKLSAEEKAIRLEERKVKRRERDRKNAAKKREAKKADALQTEVDKKILRDAARNE